MVLDYSQNGLKVVFDDNMNLVKEVVSCYKVIRIKVTLPEKYSAVLIEE